MKTNKEFESLTKDEVKDYFDSLSTEDVESLTKFQKDAYDKYVSGEEDEDETEEVEKVYTLKDNRLFIGTKTIERHEFDDEQYKKLVKVVGTEKEAEKYLIKVTPEQLKKLKEESKSGVVASNKQEAGK